MKLPSRVGVVAVGLQLLAGVPADMAACSWDYTIWMIRTPGADPLYRFTVGGKAGYIDSRGTILIEPRFPGRRNGGGEFFSGLLHLGEGRFVDRTGEVVLETGFSRTWSFSDGLAAAMRHESGAWGYIDTSGRFVIEPRFESFPRGYIHSFREGWARVEVGSRTGYIDRSGEFVIPPEFAAAWDFHDGMARVVLEGPCWYPAENGPCGGRATAPRGTLRPGSLEAEVPPCRFTYVDRAGAVLSVEGFEEAADFSEGRAAVQVEGLWGYIDRSGSLIIDPQFRLAGPFSDGRARVAPAEGEFLYGYVDERGEIRIDPRFQYADDFREGRAAVLGRDGLWRYLNPQGADAFPGRYRKASHFYEGLAHVQLLTPPGEPETFAYVDRSGKPVFTYQPVTRDQ